MRTLAVILTLFVIAVLAILVQMENRQEALNTAPIDAGLL